MKRSFIQDRGDTVMTVSEKIIFDYDQNADVLYASVGTPQPAISQEEADNILIRRHPKSREIVGFTILDYGKMKSSGRRIEVPHFEAVSLP